MGNKIKTGPSLFSRILALFGVMITVGLIVVFFVALKYSTLFLAPEEQSRQLVVPIPQGASPSQIGQILEETGAIKSAWAFNWALRAKAKIDKKPVVLKAGEMILDPSLPVWGNIDLLAKGNYKMHPFTVPEGRNMREIAQMVENASLGEANEFLALCQDKNFIASLGLEGDSLEGYLFPETYNFPQGTPLKTIIKTMTDRFLLIWAKYDDLAQSQNMNRHKVLTLASIVEKETGAPHERPLIAGVFLNRLAKGMRLETDPTVVYGLTDFSGTITRANLRTPHAYNTYIIPGLPPGPISNPGEAAISAVLKPAESDYYFFVSKNDGTHHFSKNLAEHNRNVDKYQRSGRRNPSGQ
ncbi:MAG: endolytic transglycosylase MltG [Candidatus Adiutrix sp.]